MILLFLLGLDEKCVGQIKHPDPVPNAKIVYLEVLLRHGQRTPQTAYLEPMFRGFWQCDSDDAIAPRMYASNKSDYRRYRQVMDPRLTEFLPNCRAGDLLLSGMEAHHQLGSSYHQYMFYDVKLFNGAPKEGEVYARCTDIERTFRSAQSFLDTALPPQGPGEYMKIEHGAPENEILRPAYDLCKEQNDAYQNWLASEEFKVWSEEAWKDIDFIRTRLNLDKNPSNLNLIADWVATHYCNGKKIPLFNITESLIQRCREISGYFMFGLAAYKDYKDAPIYASHIMREVLRVSNDVISGKSNIKFTLNSAHDSTIACLLAYLRNPLKVIPPFASHFAMEIWNQDGKNKVRWVFNGDVLKLPMFNNQELIDYDDFVKGTKDVYDYCKEMP